MIILRTQECGWRITWKMMDIRMWMYPRNIANLIMSRKSTRMLMINSDYFEKPDDGVYPWNNDMLYKIASAAIGDYHSGKERGHYAEQP